MNESSYKHNYEYLSIEEAKAIINGTFVQGSTSIGGELATKSDIDSLLDAAGKHMTSIVAGDNNEYVCYFEWASNRIDPTGVHVTNIILQVGSNQKISYELTPSNATVDSCVYEITSGSEYIHITDGVIYADAVGEATCKITINGNIANTFAISVIKGNSERMSGDVFIIRRPSSGSQVIIDLHSPEYCYNFSSWRPSNNNEMIYPQVYCSNLDATWWGTKTSQIIIDIDAIRKTYQSIKNKPSLQKNRTIEDACKLNDGHYAYIYLYADNYVDSSMLNKVYTVPCRAYKKSSNSSISFDSGKRYVELNGYTATGDVKNINYLVYGSLIDNTIWKKNNVISNWASSNGEKKYSDYFTRCGTLYAYIQIDLDSTGDTSVFNFVSFGDGYFDKGYNFYKNNIEINNMSIDTTTNSLNVDGDNVELNITVNKINGSADVSKLTGAMFASCFEDGNEVASETYYGTDSNGAFLWLDSIQSLPYTTQINISKRNFNKIQLYASAIDTDNMKIYKTQSAIKEITL